MATVKLPSPSRSLSGSALAQPLPIRNLLKDFTSHNPLRSPSPLPPSSRVDPKITQRLPPPTSASPLLWTIPTWWLFLRFIVTKGLHVIWNILCHIVVGPKRKSWGFRMTIITSFMRNIADHSVLADIALIRKFIDLQYLVPLPGDAIVTPVSFTVPLRKGDEVARGFMRELDMQETGERVLTGEWVVGTSIWKKGNAALRAKIGQKRRDSPLATRQSGSGMNGNTQIHGRSGPGLRPSEPKKRTDSGSVSSSVRRRRPGERVIYYIHGGAYYVGNAATHRLVTIGVSKATHARVFAITYRLAPEHAFPIPLHDVLQGYFRLLSPPLSIPPENIIIAGDSAGGGLGLALCMYLRDEGYKIPAGLVLMSPWVDLTMSCGSWDDCADSDVVPRPESDDHLNPVGCYLGPEGISKYLTHPYASPLFGDLSNLPPMLIQSGDSEVLRDEITLLAHKATLSGAQVTHELYEDMVHVFQMFSFLPAATAAINNIGKWVRVTLPKIEEEQRAKAAQEGKDVGDGLGDLGDSVQEEISKEARVVSGDGQEVGIPAGQTEVLPTEVDASLDYAAMSRSPKPRTPRRSSLHLSIGPDSGKDQVESQNDVDNAERDSAAIVSGERPTIDVDSLPAHPAAQTNGLPTIEGEQMEHDHDDIDTRTEVGSRSGTPTPTGARSRSPALALAGVPSLQPSSLFEAEDPFTTSRHTLPRLRRSRTATDTPTIPTSPPPPQPYFRRRRPTIAASLQVSPAHSVYAPSNPVSPTPSIRKRLRGSTVSFSQNPSTRMRSRSHSDIFQLVEGYVEGGAANETTVIAPGGEIKSVGVLGGEEDEEF
ncbi:esterase [Kwoniella heveanensis CBS 569]|nr:esterase [Kwoniella heveanensis CBS 569]